MKKKLQAFLLILCVLISVVYTGCGKATNNNGEVVDNTEGTEADSTTAENSLKDSPMIQANTGKLNVYDDNYRTYSEIFLYSYYDSDGDGIGDIQGLIDKLDYLNDGDDSTDTDLGVNGIWLMPIMPATTYHKYDVTDYYGIDSQYGTMEDFEELITACHERGINVIIDFVMNHTSSQHPWFQAACKYLQGLVEGEQPSAEDCPYYAYYNFSQTVKNDNWYQVEGTDWYYEAPFWSEMPDLNLGNEQVRQEIDDITTFWLDKGVDGFRLDAAKEYYSDTVDPNIEVLTWFQDMVKAKKEDAYIVAEVWTDMETYAKYYVSGIDSCFNFDFANSDGIIANTLKNASGYTASSYGKAVAGLASTFGTYNENYIDAPFYTNHDMGRSAGYYSGDNSEAQTKMAGAMNLFMSGSAFVYYGEELGMKGSGIDENKRAPMQWSSDLDVEGMCDGPEGREAIKMKYGSLEDQAEDAGSIYNFYKQAIKLRNIYPEIARGDVTFVKELSDDEVCAIQKNYNNESIMILFNLSAVQKTVDVSEITLQKEDGTTEMGGMLITGDEAVTYENGTVTMPAYSAIILK